LFTLSGIHNANVALLQGLNLSDVEERANLAADFWSEVARQIPDWQGAKDRKLSAADLRRDFVHSHALALAALARAGNTLLRMENRAWKPVLRKLASLDWSRANTSLWEGRAMSAGRLSKRNVNVTLTGNVIKQHLGLELTQDEQHLENQYVRSTSGRHRNR